MDTELGALTRRLHGVLLLGDGCLHVLDSRRFLSL